MTTTKTTSSSNSLIRGHPFLYVFLVASAMAIVSIFSQHESIRHNLSYTVDLKSESKVKVKVKLIQERIESIDNLSKTASPSLSALSTTTPIITTRTNNASVPVPVPVPVSIPTLSEHKNEYYKHDFSYDHERWENNNNGPRIVVLAGPHKTASTTLQDFFANIAGSTISVVANHSNTTTNNDITKQQQTLKQEQPHPTVTEWVWPVGVREEYKDRMKVLGSAAKFYATLASFVTGRRKNYYIYRQNNSGKSEQEKEETNAFVVEYYRSLFRRPWEEGKNLVIGAEAFDTLTFGLLNKKAASRQLGEETHVSPDSSQIIDALVDLFPWDTTAAVLSATATASPDTNNNSIGEGQSSKSTGTSSFRTVPPLRLEDIEIHINYRTPRIDHVVSIWHQLGGKKRFSKFLAKPQSSQNIYQSNSLALALQFVRKGIKTTIVDMAGAYEHKSRVISSNEPSSIQDEQHEEEMNSANITVVEGLQGVVACDILQMGRNKNQDDGGGLWCDSNSKLYMVGFEQEVTDKNKKSDKNERCLSDGQMQAINRAFEEYDCGVWQHLQKYQEQGLLRILYPSEHLFSTCNLEGSPDLAFRVLLAKVRKIANNPNGRVSK
jgi:hypothetical protein